MPSKSLFHTFLAPDEGYSRFVKLHDRLYSGQLEPNLRLDIDYIPHISIGNAKDKFDCKALADDWNKNEFSIPGKISKLTLINYENGRVIKLDEIELE